MHKSKLSHSIIGILLLIGAISIISCATATQAQINYPNHPRSILIMPPINQSVDIGAPSTFLATAAYPLAESGYYVLPPTLTTEMFRQNGVTVAEEAHAIPHSRLHEIFGADAAIYITITQYGATYYVITSAVQAYATARLVDLRSGHTLWSDEVRVTDSTSSSSNQQSILTTLLEAAIDQVANVLRNRAYDTGRKANQQLLTAGRERGLMYGPYHPEFDTE